MASKCRSPFSSPTANIIRNHAACIAALPDPRTDEPQFRAREYKLLSESVRRKLQQKEIISIVRNGSREGTNEWVVDTAAYKRACGITETREDSDTLPCGHTGIRNVRDGSFECRDCGEPITREQAKAVIG